MNSVKIIRTNSSNEEFQNLIKELDADLKIRDGESHSFFTQFNKVDKINHVVIAYLNENPVGCGAIKHYSDTTMEVKRMYVNPDFRGNRIAVKILDELENWAIELGYERCILETGLKQPEAIALYERCGYTRIENYDQYKDVEESVCYEKILK
ncbi:GNAT family N-acetyltransferase [Empedobacter brevis]|uniref:GNAT family N-acetyltransferase n=1 Tax=Empedobacter brevis TaxID=247 RepID=UPI0039AF1343